MLNYILMFLSMYRAITIPMIDIKSGIIPSLIGIYCFLKLKKKKEIIYVLAFQLLLFLVFLITFLINLPNNFSGIKIVILDISILFQALAIVYFMPKNKNLNDIFNIFINIVLFQSFIGILFWIYPEIGININKIFLINHSTLEKMKDIQGRRFFGIGTLYFGAGIYNTIAIILLSYQYKVSGKSIKLLKIIFISLIGNFYSRSTVIGLVLSIIYLGRSLKSKQIKKTIIVLISLLILSLVMISILKKEFIDKDLNLLFNWAFEIVRDLFDNRIGKSESASTLIGFFKIVPETIKTFLIGDGVWELQGEYYKKIDVGYLRLVFLFGISGLILVVLKVIFIIKMINIKSKIKINRLLNVLLLLYIILSLKGYVNINLIFYIIYINLFYKNNGGVLNVRKNRRAKSNYYCDNV